MTSSVKKIPQYWLFQSLGWGSFVAINTFFAATFNQIDGVYAGRLLLFITVGFLLSNLMRGLIKNIKLLKRELKYQIIGFIVISILFACIAGLIETYLTPLFNLGYKEEIKLDRTQQIIANSFSAFVFLFIWNCLYFIYHYVAESRRQQLDTLKLETLVKSLELKTIKSHINPHFIFNALNSIRALIDEDPARSRQAITALSNILRSSMVSDQVETISFEKEISIVQDYLALEQIRFEDRLVVVYDIAEDSAQIPVPPMMLQMLVENAIKHGISKSVKGGEVKIISQKTNSEFHLIVQNTGHFQTRLNEEGFGLQSTEDRLNLIFGGAASFSIIEKEDSIVEARVIIPLP